MSDISLSPRGERRLTQKLQRLFWRLIAVLPDRPYIRWKYFSMAGRFPDLERPRLFSEKVQARKLYDRNPIYPRVVDKHAAKALIAERAGAQYVIPTYWVGRDLQQVDWSAVPLPAVVKPTHASGCGVFLRDQGDIDRLLAEDPGPGWLALKHHRINREWAYGAFEPVIIVEKMLVENGQAPDDHCFFVFSGQVSHIEMRLRRNGVGYECNFTPDWQRMEHTSGYYDAYPGDVPRPERLDEMLEVVRKIAGDSDFMRVDLYLANGRVQVGELTLYPGGGFKGCVPDAYDERLGMLWKQELPHRPG
ncbi:ATP-grasp fold amidoligase family protein [Mycoplana dimorpha]|uniref:Teichuronopeptide biosynthesis TupA-like protein n=1 Tax=Mycoplana dimorpha TaxID=28320 RepID=A0A2T5B647_MYCDI|nr:ATP-grasp fold amidoligase family protein [Mycoplana dimorpha]PTM94403.1 teichuronopeptide biosynthesis TupA-like protein [Mycoplana dimorpha]